MVQLTWPMIAVGWVVNLFQRGTASVVRIDELLKQKPDHRRRPSRRLLPSGEDAGSPIPLSPATSNSATSTSPTPPAPSPAQHQPPHPRRLLPRHRRPHRLRQVHAGQASSRASTTPTRRGPHRRPTPSATSLSTPCAARSASSRRRPFSSPTPSRTTSPSARPTPRAADRRVAAAIRPHRHEILEFPKGFNTIVGERGITLSGGQKQRTAIARAVIRNPRILILDDALASVDTYTEEQILNGLRAIMRGRTTIFISHRVSTARNADQIAVLHQGRIAELGTHDQLLARNGYYTVRPPFWRPPFRL
jgi:ATP-binding cassette subfamily B multidrug efflux pump